MYKDNPVQIKMKTAVVEIGIPATAVLAFINISLLAFLLGSSSIISPISQFRALQK